MQFVNGSSFHFILATICVFLDWWTFFTAVAAKHTTVKLFWFQNCLAFFAFIKVLTIISWHGFFFLVSAMWAGDG